MDGYKVYREIFASLPAIDGRLEDLTQEQRDTYIKMLYKNTNEVLKTGVLIPIKESHVDDGDETLHGTLMGVRLSYKKNPTPHYVIQGEIFLDNEYYELYKIGKLPACSVEIAEGANLMAFTGRETKVGEYIYAVSLLGKTPVAMPQLKQIEVDPRPYQLYSRLLDGIKIYECKDYLTMPMMDKDTLKSRLLDLVDELFTDEKEMGGEEVKDEKKLGKKEDAKDKKMEAADKKDEFPVEVLEQDDEEPKEDKDKIISELRAKMKKMEEDMIDTEYRNLASTGKLTIEQKPHFSQVAKTSGLKFAREVFGALPSTSAPIGEVIQSADTIDGDTRLRTTYKNMGLKDAEIEKIFKVQTNKRKGL